MVIWEGSWDTEEKKYHSCVQEGQYEESGDYRLVSLNSVPEKGKKQELFYEGQNTVSTKVWKYL